MYYSKTKFRIGTVTKQFTAVAILQLCEKGLINLNDVECGGNIRKRIVHGGSIPGFL